MGQVSLSECPIHIRRAWEEVDYLIHAMKKLLAEELSGKRRLPIPIERAQWQREGMRATSHLLGAQAWLMAQRAALNGEITFGEALEFPVVKPFPMENYPIEDEMLRAILARAEALSERIGRLSGFLTEIYARTEQSMEPLEGR